MNSNKLAIIKRLAALGINDDLAKEEYAGVIGSVDLLLLKAQQKSHEIDKAIEDAIFFKDKIKSQMPVDTHTHNEVPLVPLTTQVKVFANYESSLQQIEEKIKSLQKTKSKIDAIVVNIINSINSGEKQIKES